MLSVNVVCIGKIKEAFYRDAIEEYAKRLSRFCRFSVIELAEKQLTGKNDADISIVKEDEGKRIVQAVKGYVIALDMRGEQLTSEQLSAKLSKLTDTTSTVTFVIGGSYGLSDNVLKRADYKLSFGKMTFPHQLMRVIAAEQIYRAFTIAEGSGYHK